MAAFRVVLLVPFNFNIGTTLDTIGTIIWQINSERYMFANGSLFTNCTNGIAVADILSIDNLYGTIVNVYINNISYCWPL